MSFLYEFKEFAMRGNVIDMAVGVIIGAAFGKITASLVSDIIMPVLGKFTGFMDFSNRFISLSSNSYPTLKAAKDAGVPVIAYGQFINVILDFILIALAVFMVVRLMNHFQKEQEVASKSVCPFCKETIVEGASRCPHCSSFLAEDTSNDIPDWPAIERFMDMVLSYIPELPQNYKYYVYPLTASFLDEFFDTFKTDSFSGQQVYVHTVDTSVPESEQVVGYVISEERTESYTIFRIFCSSYSECMDDLKESFKEILHLY